MAMDAGSPHHAERRIDRIRDPAYPLCREDLIWLLDAVKKKVADGDPVLQDLPRPQLLSLFRDFAEAAMMLIHRQPRTAAELDRMLISLTEAVFRPVDS